MFDDFGGGPGLGSEQHTRTVADLAKFDERFRHCAYIVRNNDSPCLGSHLQNREIVNIIEGLSLKIYSGQTAQNTANDGATQIVVSLESDLHAMRSIGERLRIAQQCSALVDQPSSGTPPTFLLAPSDILPLWPDSRGST